MKTQTKETQQKMTPQAALNILIEGNTRFTENVRGNRDLIEQVGETTNGQYPFAVILSCIDSRVSAELVFDQGVSDIFSARVAGNIINEDVLGSIEFACAAAGAKLIVVLGHSSCGAVKGACDHRLNGDDGFPVNLVELLKKVHPAIDATHEDGDRSSANKDFVQRVTDLNVIMATQQLIDQSAVLKKMLEEGEIGMVGAMYSVTTGQVAFGEL
ncbi:MAG: carbonic anhydrase [Oceanospirillaceae bacterium]|jgi:carbonic anhydrase